MNAEQIAKLKDAASRVNQFYDPSQASSEDLTTITNELPELIALAERTTSPVSQMTTTANNALLHAHRVLSDFYANAKVRGCESVYKHFQEAALECEVAAAAPHAQDNEGEKA